MVERVNLNGLETYPSRAMFGLVTRGVIAVYGETRRGDGAREVRGRCYYEGLGRSGRGEWGNNVGRWAVTFRQG